MDADLQDAQIVDRQTFLLLGLSREKTGVVAATHRTCHSSTGLEPGRETVEMDSVTAKSKCAGL